MESKLTAQQMIEHMEYEEIDSYDLWGSLLGLGFQYAHYCQHDREWEDMDAAEKVDRILYEDLKYRPGAGSGEPEEIDSFRTEMLPRVASDSDLVTIGQYINTRIDQVPEENRY